MLQALIREKPTFRYTYKLKSLPGVKTNILHNVAASLQKVERDTKGSLKMEKKA